MVLWHDVKRNDAKREAGVPEISDVSLVHTGPSVYEGRE